jgi:hypothetical protein
MGSRQARNFSRELLREITDAIFVNVFHSYISWSDSSGREQVTAISARYVIRFSARKGG